MMPLSIFESKQFTAANLVTFCVYAALSGVFFLLVAFLQITMGYSAIAAGSAALPVTVILLLFSSRAGALATRIGPKLPLTIGPIGIAAGMLLMLRIDPGDSYLSTVFPAVMVYGAGLRAGRRPGDGDGPRRGRRPPRRRRLGDQQRRRPSCRADRRRGPAADRGTLGRGVLRPGGDGRRVQDRDGGDRVPVARGGPDRVPHDRLRGVGAGGRPEHDCDRAATDRNCGVAGTPLRPGRHVGDEAAAEPAGVSEPSR